MKLQLSSTSFHDFTAQPVGGLSSARLMELLQKYDRPGPRYTSYPPATEFKAMTAGVYLDALERQSAQLGDLEPLSLYIHIPFCASPCFYCGCNIAILNEFNSRSGFANFFHKLVMSWPI